MSTFQNTSGDITITVGPSGTDVFTINGDLTVTGNASLTGNIAGDKIYSGSSNVVIDSSGGNIIMGVGGTPNVFVATTSGISASGNITANNTMIATNGNIISNLIVNNRLTSSSLSVTGNVIGNLTIEGEVFAQVFVTTNYVATDALLVLGNTAKVTTASYDIGYKDIPQVSLSSNVVPDLTVAGKHYYSTTAGNLEITLPSNANVGFNVGSSFDVVLQAAGNIIIGTQSGVTLYLAGNSTSGNRVVASYGKANLLKVDTDTWFIDGTGVN